jgi:VIT1/CCC1 family predicted Fe2+/Mn2+ transporter
LLSDGERGQRFLDLTGLTPDSLRMAIGEESTHRAVFEFLESHEPDLLAAAEALDIPPQDLARAGQELGR